MRDYGPLPACPSSKGGRHRGSSFVTVNDEGQSTFTWTCDVCGTTRLVGPDGFADDTPLDDLTADEIERRIYGRGR